MNESEEISNFNLIKNIGIMLIDPVLFSIQKGLSLNDFIKICELTWNTCPLNDDLHEEKPPPERQGKRRSAK